MKICSQCNTENLDNNSFCAECGTPLSNELNEAIQQPKKSSKGKKTVVIAIIAAVLLICAIVGVGVYNQVQERILEEQRHEKVEKFKSSLEYTGIMSILNSSFSSYGVETFVNEEEMAFEVSVTVDVPSSAFSNYLIRNTWGTTTNQIKSLTSSIYVMTEKYELDCVFNVYSSDSKKILTIENESITYNIVD